MAINVEMVKLAERPELQDSLLDKVFNTGKLRDLALINGFENVVQMFYQTLPYVAEVNQGTDHYAFTNVNNREVIRWDCNTGEQLEIFQYQTPDQVVNFIKTYDKTNVLTEKSLTDFFKQMNRERIMIGGPVLEMGR